MKWAAVVAQLTQWSLPLLEDPFMEQLLNVDLL